LPLFIHQFIEIVVDVESGGHYGFRVVFGLNGRYVKSHSIICLDITQRLTQ